MELGPSSDGSDAGLSPFVGKQPARIPCRSPRIGPTSLPNALPSGDPLNETARGRWSRLHGPSVSNGANRSWLTRLDSLLFATEWNSKLADAVTSKPGMIETWLACEAERYAPDPNGN